jgi:hypothetical protein
LFAGVTAICAGAASFTAAAASAAVFADGAVQYCLLVRELVLLVLVHHRCLLLPLQVQYVCWGSAALFAGGVAAAWATFFAGVAAVGLLVLVQVWHCLLVLQLVLGFCC